MEPRTQLGKLRQSVTRKSLVRMSGVLAVGRDYLARIERGEARPSVKLMNRMAAAYKTPAVRLWEMWKVEEHAYVRSRMEKMRGEE